MHVIIDTIPHELQRYDTVGDWIFNGAELHIKVSSLIDSRSEMAIAIHELVEAFLCKESGITTEVVDNWDLSHPGFNEPGEIPSCPYYQQHIMATAIEMLVLQMSNVSWKDHNNNLDHKL